MESINVVFCFVVAAVIASTLNIISVYQRTKAKKQYAEMVKIIKERNDIYIDI